MKLTNRQRRLRNGARPWFRPICELLEDRRLLASFVVDNLGDTHDANPGNGVAEDAMGNTTLRAAIEEANALGGTDDITFSVAGTVSLTLGTLPIASSMTIDGGNAISVDANAASRVMTIDDGNGTLDTSTVELRNMTVRNGRATQGGGILSVERTTISGVTVSGNTASDEDIAFGGGILTRGTMLVRNSMITGNTAVNPVGSNLPSGTGGGIAGYGTGSSLTIEDSTVSGNTSSRYGGGVNTTQGYLRIVDSRVTGNTTGQPGWAFFIGGAGVGGTSYLASGNGRFDVVVESSLVADNMLLGDNFPYGSGIYGAGYGTFTVTDSMVTDNSVAGAGASRGGAGFFYAPTFAVGPMYLNFTNTVFDSNYSTAESGGVGFRTRTGSLLEMNIVACTISNNTALSSGGASFSWIPGAYNFGDANITIVDSTITGNRALYGGAFGFYYGVGVTIERTTIDGNQASEQGGGMSVAGIAVGINAKPVVTLVDSTISNNLAGTSGGGMYSVDAELFLIQSTVSGNQAANGGGLFTSSYYDYAPLQSLTTVDRATITNNTASGYGGGIYGAYYHLLELRNTIISGNNASTAPDFNVSTYAAAQMYYSFLGNNEGTVFSPGNPDPDGNKIGDSSAPLNAMLGALADNGGPTRTHLPLAGSPVIDMADPSIPPGMYLDQRGAERVVDGDGMGGARMDMGSVEYGSNVGYLCDFTGEGDCNTDDIDLLMLEVIARFPFGGVNGANTTYDINADGFTNAGDRNLWLALAGQKNLISGNAFFVGDANLDGIKDGLDFARWNTNKFMPSDPVHPWSNGEFNGDGFKDGLDFALWNIDKFIYVGPAPKSGNDDVTITGLADRSTEGKDRPEQHVNGRKDFRSIHAVRDGSSRRAPVTAMPVVAPAIRATATAAERETTSQPVAVRVDAAFASELPGRPLSPVKSGDSRSLTTSSRTADDEAGLRPLEEFFARLGT